MTDTSAPPANVWLANLSPDVSMFRGAAGRFRLESAGYVGSIGQVPRSIAYDPYVQRAIRRGRLKMLTEEEAMDFLPQLQIREFSDETPHRVLENLELGVSERSGRYTRDVPDEAVAQKSVDPKDVWADQGPQQPTITRSDGKQLDPTRTGFIDSPEPPEWMQGQNAILTGQPQAPASTPASDVAARIAGADGQDPVPAGAPPAVFTPVPGGPTVPPSTIATPQEAAEAHANQPPPVDPENPNANLDVSAVLTAPVKEGEMLPDTGI